MLEKPPLGLHPKRFHEAARFREILEAMQRYSDALRPIPKEWIDEIGELYTIARNQA